MAPPAVRPIDTEAAQAMAFPVLLRNAISFPAFLGTLLVGAAFVLERAFYLDPDVWWHIKVGENILQPHRLPTADPYSVPAPGSPWISYQWLGEVGLALAARAGLRGLSVLQVALSAVIL